MFIPALIEEFLKSGEGASIADAIRRRTAKRTEAIREQVLQKFLTLAEAEGDPETIAKAKEIVAEIRRNR